MHSYVHVLELMLRLQAGLCMNTHASGPEIESFRVRGTRGGLSGDYLNEMGSVSFRSPASIRLPDTLAFHELGAIRTPEKQRMQPICREC